MKTRSRRDTLAGVVALSACVMLCGCDVGKALNPTSVSEARSELASRTAQVVDDSALVEAGTLTVGVDLGTSTAPLCFSSDDGGVAGVSVDLASAVADQMGLSVRFVNVSDSASALGSSCDIVMGAKSSEKGAYSVVGSYAESAAGLFGRGASGSVGASDLDAKTVGVQTGSVSDSILRASSLSMKEQGFSNLNDAFEALEAGSVDYVLCDAYSGLYLAGAYKDISLAGTIDVPLSVGVACSSSNSPLQSAVSDALASVQSNGRYDIIRSRWLGGAAQLSGSSQIQGVAVSSSEAPGDSLDSASPTSSNGSTAGSNAVSL